MLFRSDKDLNGNDGTGYFVLTATVGNEVPAGAGVLRVEAAANALYAGSYLEETPVSGAPKKIDSGKKSVVKKSIPNKIAVKNSAVKKVPADVKVPAKAKVLSMPKIKSSKLR